MRFWDRYGVWIVVYVYLLTRTSVAHAEKGDDVWLQVFLLLNLMASFGVGYLALLRRFAPFRTWAPLVLRWLWRWMLYGFVWFNLVGAVHSATNFAGSLATLWMISLLISGAFVARLALRDIRKQGKPTLALFS
jgi:hypothetical protein